MITLACANCGRSFMSAAPHQTLCPFCSQPAAFGGPAAPGGREPRDLRMVAKRQRWLLWLVLAAIAANALTIFVRLSGAPMLGIGVTAMLLMVTIVILVGVVQLLIALRTNVILIVLCALLTFAPCINLLTLMVVNMITTGILRRAGLKVGFMGVRDDDVVRHLDPNICKVCGYNLTGNVSGRCSECGTPIQRAIPIAKPVSSI